MDCYRRCWACSVVSVPILDRTFFAEYGEKAITDPYSARVGLVVLKGSFTVASSRKLTEVIGADVKDHEIVIFDFSETIHLDDSAAMVVSKLMDAATEQQTEFIIVGLSDSVAHILLALGVLQQAPKERIVKTLDEARRVAFGLIHQRSIR